jgi:NTP pyrophosphatase (non-canonical NTP hydrolase)
MSYFKKLVKQEIRESLIQLPFHDDPTLWTEQLADNITSKFEGRYVPFITEVEEFNTVMGKEWQNRTEPTIDKKDAEFVINFIQEELDELREAVEQENIQEVLDAILDITYVGLGNGAMVFGLKDKIWEAYQEVQASNLSKICTTLEEAEETVKVRSEQQGEPCHYEEVGSNYVVYRTSDKKVMKSINYFRPDLSKFFNV